MGFDPENVVQENQLELEFNSFVLLAKALH
jgi:hypothetical protein